MKHVMIKVLDRNDFLKSFKSWMLNNADDEGDQVVFHLDDVCVCVRACVCMWAITGWGFRHEEDTHAIIHTLPTKP